VLCLSPLTPLLLCCVCLQNMCKLSKSQAVNMQLSFPARVVMCLQVTWHPTKPTLLASSSIDGSVVAFQTDGSKLKVSIRVRFSRMHVPACQSSICNHAMLCHDACSSHKPYLSSKPSSILACFLLLCVVCVIKGAPALWCCLRLCMGKGRLSTGNNQRGRHGSCVSSHAG
jgi:hypothetical protein